MTRLVLVRHGESTWNVVRRIQGQSGAGLSDRGRAQAERTAAWLAESYPDAHLYASDLQRCVESAQPLEGVLGRSATAMPGLRERAFGDWTGRLITEVAELDPPRWERWHRGEDVIGEVGGESTDVFRQRIKAALAAIVAPLGEHEAAICVTHGGPVWHGVHGLLDLPTATLGGVGNASITEVGLDGGSRGWLVTWNQVAHLPRELRADPPRSVDAERRPASRGDRAAAPPPVGT